MPTSHWLTLYTPPTSQVRSSCHQSPTLTSPTAPPPYLSTHFLSPKPPPLPLPLPLPLPEWRCVEKGWCSWSPPAGGSLHPRRTFTPKQNKQANKQTMTSLPTLHRQHIASAPPTNGWTHFSDPARSTSLSLPMVTTLPPLPSYTACSTMMVKTAWLLLLSC